MNIKLLTAAVLAFGVSFGAQASLTSSGPLTVFDSAQTLTWTKNANLNGQMNWATAVAWAENLNYAGYTDWVLPTIIQLTTNLNQPHDLFTNVQTFGVYWSASEYGPSYPDFAWGFDNDFDSVGGYYKGGQFSAWAVRPGDVAAVPVPGAFGRFGSAMVVLMGLKRCGNIG